MALVACRSGIVGGEQSGIAEAVIHGAQIGRTRKDIVARIIWIATQTTLPTHCRPGVGHELHQSHRASPAGDTMAMQMRLSGAFTLHDGVDPALRNPGSATGLRVLTTTALSRHYSMEYTLHHVWRT